MNARRKALQLLVLLAAAALPAAGALFVVDTTLVDLGDIAPGDGKCEWATFIPVGQRCSLRAAIQEANALAGADVVLIPDGWHVRLNRPGAGEDAANTGDLDVREDVTIGSLAPAHAWPIVDGNQLDRVFDVHPPATLTVGALEITGGKTIFQGGGFFVRANAGLEAFNCRIYDNRGDGGAVRNEGVTTIDRCSIFQNLGHNGYDSPSALYNLGTMEIGASTVRDNREAHAAIRCTTMTGLTIRNSTIADNTGVIGDSASGVGIDCNADVVLRNVTLTGHQAIGLEIYRAGAFSSPSIRNTIVANNGTDCMISTPGGVSDIAHPNLDSDGSCGFPPASGGISSTDPKLGPLALNGGTTLTRVPLEGSPVVEAGSNASCEAADQRGAIRPLDGDNFGAAVCDLGAVEVLPCPGTGHLLVTNEMISTVEEFVACFVLTAEGPALEVLAGGNATFRARDLVVLANDVSVRPGGRLTIVLDPAAGSGIALP